MSNQNTANVILDSCRYIFLSKLENDASFILTIHISEGRIQEESGVGAIESNNLGSILEKAHPVKIRKGYNAFKIVFKDYTSFAVRNESYIISENDEDYSSRLRVHQHSNFLNFISESTWLSSVDLESLIHYTVVCSDHIIDIATSSEPVIEHYLLDVDAQ